jgi:hypothetical protein
MIIFLQLHIGVCSIDTNAKSFIRILFFLERYFLRNKETVKAINSSTEGFLRSGIYTF